jgi:hypothetical protein
LTPSADRRTRYLDCASDAKYACASLMSRNT